MTQIDSPCARPDRPLRHQALRYAALSVLSFIINLLLTVGLHEGLRLPSYLAVPIAMGFVTVMNFCTIRLLVFDRRGRGWSGQLVGYVASTAGFRGAEYVVFLLLVSVMGLPYLPAYAGVLAASVVGKFLFLRGLVFAGPARVTPRVETAI